MIACIEGRIGMNAPPVLVISQTVSGREFINKTSDNVTIKDSTTGPLSEYRAYCAF